MRGLYNLFDIGSGIFWKECPEIYSNKSILKFPFDTGGLLFWLNPMFSSELFGK